MAYLHFENQFVRVNDKSYIDYSSVMMVLLIKLSSFGWNVYDSRLLNAPASGLPLNEYQKSKVRSTVGNYVIATKIFSNLTNYFAGDQRVSNHG